MTSEIERNQEVYLGKIGCDLGLIELEVVFMILDYSGRDEAKFIERNIFLLNLKEFSGIPIDEKDEDDVKKIDDLLGSLCLKGYIEKENISSKIVLTEKAKEAVNKLARDAKFWKSFMPKRWRQVFFKRNKDEDHRNISYDEIKIIKELIGKTEISISYVLGTYKIEQDFLRLMEDQKRIEVFPVLGAIFKGQRFVEGLAESIYYLEKNKTEENLEEWLKNIEILFKSQRENISTEWRERYKAAYELVREFDSCPIGLSIDCKNVFKDDPDSLTRMRQLSLREKSLRINIKEGFGYSENAFDRYKRRVLNKLIIEFIQAKEIDNSNFVRLSGTKAEMIEFFENIKKEAKKMSKETGIIMESGKMGEVEVLPCRKEVVINIVAVAYTKREKIAVISFKILDEIIEDIKRYPEYQ